MVDIDGGLKYGGFALEDEYHFRWLENFKILRAAYSSSASQRSSSLRPRLSVAGISHGGSENGQYGKPFDVRAGANWFPWKNKVVRWNTEWLYLLNSPVGYSS